MTYHISGRLECSSQEQAVSLADDLTKLLDRRSVLSGTAVARTHMSGEWCVFLDVRLSVRRDRDTFFESLNARLGQTGGPVGRVGWHDCRHDEGLGVCVATEVSG
jgi:hypothetical protein